MLGTRVIMMGMDGFPGGLTGQPNAEMICAANHQLPLYWLMAFALDDIELFEVSTSESDVLTHEEGDEYPVLLTDKEDAVTRLNKRKDTLQPYLTTEELVLLEKWIGFLQQQEFPVLAIDTYELWINLNDPDQLHKEISDLLQQFSELEAKPESGLNALKASGIWMENNTINLSGYGW